VNGRADRFDALLDRYPELREAAWQLRQESEDFRTLCEDYELALAALRTVEAAEGPLATGRAIEYRALVQELGEAIREAITAAAGPVEQKKEF